MHYKNGRDAKNGDKVLLLSTYGGPVYGILYDAVYGNDACNGRIAHCHPSDPMPDLKNVLHIDDVLKAPESTVNPGELERLYVELRGYRAVFGPLPVSNASAVAEQGEAAG